MHGQSVIVPSAAEPAVSMNMSAARVRAAVAAAGYDSAASVGNDLAPRLRPGRRCVLSFFPLFHLFIPGLLVGTSKQEVIEKIRHEACGRRRRQRIEALRTVKHGITPAKLGKRNPRLIPSLGNDGPCRHHRLDGDENVIDVDDAIAAPRRAAAPSDSPMAKPMKHGPA